MEKYGRVGTVLRKENSNKVTMFFRKTMRHNSIDTIYFQILENCVVSFLPLTYVPFSIVLKNEWV